MTSISALPERWPERGAPTAFRHSVQFYDADTDLGTHLRQYFRTGLQNGESLLVIASEAHCRAIEAQLGEDGFVAAEHGARRQYVAVAAEDVLAQFMVGRRPNGERFRAAVHDLVSRTSPAKPGAGLRVYGEMVATLWEAGQHAVALELEQLWNQQPPQLQGTPPLTLRCGYPMRFFRDPGQTEGFLKICAEHSHVLPGGASREDDSPESLLRTVAQLQQKACSLESTLAQLIHSHEQERSRVGQQLHDEVAQKLALLAMQVDRLRTARQAGDGEQGETENNSDDPGCGQFTALWDMVNEVSTDVHRISHSLHCAVLEQLGLVPGLRSLIAEFSEQYGILVYLDAGPLPPLDAELNLCLYRVVQESLSNVAKHSGAVSARVSLICRDNEIEMVIEDAGRGFDAANGLHPGLGITQMRETLRQMQGVFQVHSSPLRGTRIEVRAPRKISGSLIVPTSR